MMKKNKIMIFLTVLGILSIFTFAYSLMNLNTLNNENNSLSIKQNKRQEELKKIKTLEKKPVNLEEFGKQKQLIENSFKYISQSTTEKPDVNLSKVMSKETINSILPGLTLKGNPKITDLEINVVSEGNGFYKSFGTFKLDDRKLSYEAKIDNELGVISEMDIFTDKGDK